MKKNNETKICAALKTKNLKQDSIMIELLKKTLPFETGIPPWVLREMVSRPDDPIDPRELLGINRDDFIHDEDFLSINFDQLGYTFSWGTVIEETSDFEEDGLIGLHFEFLPYQLLRLYPKPDVLDHFFLLAYRNHPLCSDQFDEYEGSNPWSVLQLFTLGTQKQIREFRKFISDVFLPLIWPDLLALSDRYVRDLEKGVILPPSEMQFLHPAMMEAMGDSTGVLSVLTRYLGDRK